IRLPEIAAPRATFTGWNLRSASFAEDALMLVGSRFPFAATKAERLANGDPRLSLEERYPSQDAYVRAVREAVDALVKDRLLLPEDAERYIEEAETLEI
ncbi:MAG: hypothetical protein HKP27_14310, partial [Myxococcales bacterium]|nr:hypothetical protein [Myxococcales bacterium]